MNARFSAVPGCALILAGAMPLSVCAGNSPSIAKMASPERNQSFGWAFDALPDLTQDGVAEFHVRDARRLYVYDGAGLNQLFAFDSAHCDPDFVTRTADCAGDLTRDGVPELCVAQNGAWLIHIFDGLSSKLLKSIKYPGPAQGNLLGGPRFNFGILREDSPPGIRASLFAAPYVANNAGRVYYMPFTPPKPLRLKPLGVSETGFRLQVIGDPGSKAQLQGTSDLSAWESVASITLEDQPFELEDPAPAHQSLRFYRALQK